MGGPRPRPASSCGARATTRCSSLGSCPAPGRREAQSRLSGLGALCRLAARTSGRTRSGAIPRPCRPPL
eukprot:4812760-Alexandrium_andersonii.AAC.1